MSETVQYRVPEMSCEHCQRAVSGEVGSLDGVSAVDVDLDTKIVTVTGERLDDGALRAAIAQAGYEVA
jgi:copper chaperone